MVIFLLEVLVNCIVTKPNLLYTSYVNSLKILEDWLSSDLRNI